MKKPIFKLIYLILKKDFKKMNDIKNSHLFLFLEYLILTMLKAITRINIITLQYQAIGAKSKQ